MQGFSEVSLILIHGLNNPAFVKKFEAFGMTRIQVTRDEVRLSQLIFEIVMTKPIKPAICATVNCYSY